MPLYPPLWKVIRNAACEHAGWKCEHCGMLFDTDNKAKTFTNKNGDPIILTVHHLDGDTTNNDWTNLLAVCQVCHLHIQAKWKPGWPLPSTWNGPPKWLLDRDLPYYVQRSLIDQFFQGL